MFVFRIYAMEKMAPFNSSFFSVKLLFFRNPHKLIICSITCTRTKTVYNCFAKPIHATYEVSNFSSGYGSPYLHQYDQSSWILLSCTDELKCEPATHFTYAQ